MSVSPVNNTTAFSVYANYAQSTVQLKASMERLASGVKGIADDAAGVGISEKMRSQARATAMARNNVENGISVLQTADGWLQRMNDLLARMHELAVESNDGTKGSSDLANVQSEFAELQEEVARIADSAATFNGQKLFDATFATGVDTQVGADAGQVISLQLANLSSGSATVIDGAALTWGDVLDATATKVDTAADASTAIESIQHAINFVADTRASAGGQQSRLEHTRAGLLTYEDNIRAAESKIRDVDMARESAEMTKNQILGQVGTAMLAQANQLPQGIVQLLG